jgi:hypothetical protein
MKKLLFYFLIFISATTLSCSKKKVVVPENVIKEDKMIVVLTDLEIAEASSAQHIIRGDSVNYTAAYLKFVFEKNKVKPEDFTYSMDWYAAHPEFQKKIYEEVVNNLSKKQSEVAN